MPAPLIESYRFGKIWIDGRRYVRDLVIYPAGVDDEWWHEKEYLLQPVDLREILQADPQPLVVRSRAAGRLKVAPGTSVILDHRRVATLVESTPKACRTYNHLCGTRHVVAALHLKW